MQGYCVRTAGFADRGHRRRTQRVRRLLSTHVCHSFRQVLSSWCVSFIGLHCCHHCILLVVAGWLAVILDGDEKQLGILMKQLSESVETIKSIAQCYGASVLPGSKYYTALYYLLSGVNNGMA